jgi:hypothetical protein
MLSNEKGQLMSGPASMDAVLASHPIENSRYVTTDELLDHLKSIPAKTVDDSYR